MKFASTMRKSSAPAQPVTYPWVRVGLANAGV